MKLTKKLNNKLNKIFLISFLIMIFASCSKDDDENNPNNNSNIGYFEFMKLGNKWEYRIGGMFSPETMEILSFDTDVTNLRRYNSDGSPLSSDGWAGEHIQWLAKDSLLWGLSGYVGQKWETDTSWHFILTNMSTGKYICTHEIISIDSIITVPAGDFSCIVIERLYSYDILNSDG